MVDTANRAAPGMRIAARAVPNLTTVATALSMIPTANVLRVPALNVRLPTQALATAATLARCSSIAREAAERTAPRRPAAAVAPKATPSQRHPRAPHRHRPAGQRRPVRRASRGDPPSPSDSGLLRDRGSAATRARAPPRPEAQGGCHPRRVQKHQGLRDGSPLRSSRGPTKSEVSLTQLLPRPAASL